MTAGRIASLHGIDGIGIGVGLVLQQNRQIELGTRIIGVLGGQIAIGLFGLRERSEGLRVIA